jgi:hypothetical protein
MNLLHFPRRHQAPKPAGPRTYIASNGQPVTVVPKTAIPLPADLGDGLDPGYAAEDRRRWADAAPAGPPWEGGSDVGRMEPLPALPGPAWRHDTVLDMPPAHYRPYVPEPGPLPVYVADLEDDVAELTIFRATVHAELIRRQAAQGNRDGRPWQERYAAAYDTLWLECDDLIDTGYFFADELRAAHADTLDAVRTDMESRMARMAGLEPVAA